MPQSQLGSVEGQKLLQRIAHEEEAPLPQELLHGSSSRGSQWISPQSPDGARLRDFSGVDVCMFLMLPSCC